MPVQDIITPAYADRPAFFPQTLKYATRKPSSRYFGIRNQYPDIPVSQLIQKVATHLQDTQGGDSTIPAENKFTLAKMGTAGGNIHGSEQDFYNAGAGYASNIGFNKKTILTSEIGEELGNHIAAANPGWDWYANVDPYVRVRTNAFLKGFTDSMLSHHGGNISDILNFGEYGSMHVPNWGNPAGVAGNVTKENGFKNSLNSQLAARKHYNTSTEGWEGFDDVYFSSGRYDRHNLLHRAYYGSLSHLGGGYIHNLLYAFERGYCSAPDRLQGVFSWDLIQDMIRLPDYSFIDAKAGWNFKFPDGTYYMGHGPGAWRVMPPIVAELVGWYSWMYTKLLVIWNSYGGFRDVAISGNHRGVLGGVDGTWKWNGNIRTWTPNGGGEQTYNESAGQPAGPGSSNTGFPPYPGTTLDMFFVGYDKGCTVEPYALEPWKYAKYSQDGGNTYFTPSSGSAGTNIGRLNNPNYNSNHPVLHPSFNGGAMVHVSSGVVSYCDLHTRHDVYKHVVVQDGANTYDLGMLRGQKLYIKRFY